MNFLYTIETKSWLVGTCGTKNADRKIWAQSWATLIIFLKGC